MSIILQSTVFKGSKNKAAILAAMNNPINRELVQQVDSFEVKEDKEVVEAPKVSSEDVTSEDGGPEFTGGGSFGGGGFVGGPSDLDFDDGEFEGEEGELLEGEEVPEGEPDGVPDLEDISDDSDDIESATEITAGTYVTIDQVTNCVNEIPGTLNCVEDTKGVTHCVLRGGSDNEIWIYYNSDVDINNILEKVNRALIMRDYNFLEFDRVSRDKNAIVYSINWVSSYYKPRMTFSNE